MKIIIGESVMRSAKLIQKNTKSVFRILVGIYILFGFTNAHLAHAELVGMQDIDLFDAKRQRPVKVRLWYPEAKEKCSKVLVCNQPQAKALMPVVLSHGSMGSAWDYSWLAQALARQGYVVAGVSHFGESWVYGPKNVNVSNAAKLWLRPQDVSFVLDALVENHLNDKPVLSTPVNWQKVIGVGHSSGGSTMLALAGSIYEVQLAQGYCDVISKDVDKSCAYKPEGKQDEKVKKLLEADYKDDRMTKLVLLDAALGHMTTASSLKKIKAKTLLVAPEANDFLNTKAHAAFYAAQLSNVQVKWLGNNAGHFTFLDVCQHNYKAMGVALCKDREGVQRGQVHREISEAVVAFSAAR